MTHINSNFFNSLDAKVQYTNHTPPQLTRSTKAIASSSPTPPSPPQTACMLAHPLLLFVQNAKMPAAHAPLLSLSRCLIQHFRSSNASCLQLTMQLKQGQRCQYIIQYIQQGSYNVRYLLTDIMQYTVTRLVYCSYLINICCDADCTHKCAQRR